MVSSSLDLPELPADVYVHLARVCAEVEVESSKGSGQLVRAKVCCFCSRSIKLGAGHSDYSLQQHMGSYQCREHQKALADADFELASFVAGLKLPDQKPSTRLFSSQSVECAVSPPVYIQRSENQLPVDNVEVCPGALVDYGVSMFSHYPWHLHDSGLLDYELSFIDPSGLFFRLSSHKCTRNSPGKGVACLACRQVVLGRQFQELMQRSRPGTSISPSTNLQFRTYSQLCDLVKDKSSKINDLKLKDMASQRCIQSLLSRMDEQKRLMLAISQSDDLAVGRIVKTALQNGAGVETIIDRIVKAQKGLYSPKNYSQKSFDLVALVLRIGGPRLAFAVAKALHLPSISTVREQLDLPRLLPSIGFPTSAEISANIESFFGSNSSISRPCTQAGWSLMIDELAQETRLRYHKSLDSVVGICREHSDNGALCQLSSRSDTLDTLIAIKEQLDSGQSHRATEATMAALARFGESDYNATVIMASGTCKAEKSVDQARWIELILKSWQESASGEARHGPIWSICTDGDNKRRRAIFPLCMSSTVSESSDLNRLIGHLPLLNLCCGPNQITHDGDYKHEEKRLASALRSRSGILVNGAHVTPKMLVHWLRSLEDLSESRILSLFDGTDPQNVPKANTLLMSLYRASQLPSATLHAHNRPFILLGEILGSFACPFTVPTMTLSEQVASLVKCAHLIFALYRIDGTKFLPGQLVYDIQASVKNFIFCIAKTKLVDPSLPFYLLQTGTDRLESRFGTYRTATSDRNGDLLQMCNRAAGAQHIDEIFSAHPDWNRAPYRLSLDGKSGVDHTNPLSWLGDTIVGNVDLHASWLCGKSQAEAVLMQNGVAFEFDPTVLHAESPTIDLMRPHGSYPGIQVDNIEPDIQPILVSELSDESSVPNHGSSDDSIDNLGDSDVESSKLIDPRLEVEQLLHATPEDIAPEGSKKGWLLVEGTWIHLESAIHFFLSIGSDPKSADRLRRVQGLSRYPTGATSSDSVLGDYFYVSGLVATFLRAKDEVVLAIARITSITGVDGRALEAISEQQFQLPGVTLSGQVLELEDDAGIWYWTERYDPVTSSTASVHRKRSVGFDLDARLCRPVNPSLIERSGDRVGRLSIHRYWP
ncbi:hypothetical protein FS749_005764 [Ceratobasidium sp. UAMH 11750]|nr:hypothetical protein FS749_005764 [Ceratobasidium sp. UAMH 11750]